jgi:hypothetical protein
MASKYHAGSGLIEELPTINDSVDGPLLKTLATVSNMYYTPVMKALYEPADEWTKKSFEKLGWETLGEVARAHFDDAIKSYGTVIDGITDWRLEDAIPPFAALVVKPEDGKASSARALPEAPPHDMYTRLQRPERVECCLHPTGTHPHLHLARIRSGVGLHQ